MEKKASLPCSQKPASSPNGINCYIDGKNLVDEELHEIKPTIDKCGQIIIHVICVSTNFMIPFSDFMKLCSYKNKATTDELTSNK
jgi:hypothetical protein